MPSLRAPTQAAVLLFASAVTAPAAGAEDAKPPAVPLKVQRSLLEPPADREKAPIYIDADEIRGVQEKELEASGNVRLRRLNENIRADWLLYTAPDDEVDARGNVRIERDGDVFEGTQARLNMETDRGFLQSPVYSLGQQGARGTAETFYFEGKNQYRATNGAYTTCGPGQDDWFMRARDFRIDRDRQIGTAYDATVVFMDTPILYAPWLEFSLNRERKSGFLSPTVATSGKSGAEFSIPYYWNIAPNRDATFTPRVMGRRGFMLGSEFRYLEPQYAGEARYEVLPKDNARGSDTRWALSLRHQQVYGPWSGRVNFQKVSDDDYFRDLSTQLAFTSLSVLPREVQVNRSGRLGEGGAWNASMLVQRWQTLQDPKAPLSPPYNRQPQFNLNADKYDLLGGTDLNFTGTVVEFDHPRLVNGRRWVGYPSVSLPLRTAYGYFMPKVGVHHTQYQLDTRTTVLQDGSRTLPIMSADAGLVFERNADIFGRGYLQTLEPRLYYVYIPFENQRRLPVFDTGQSDINFATIFAENQFSGPDRINDANQLTFGVTTRLLNPATGAQTFRATVAQRYYFTSQRVTLPGVPARTTPNSDILVAAGGVLAPGVSADIGWQYDGEAAQTQKFAVGARYHPDFGKVLNVGYRFTRNSIDQVDVSAQWPIGWRVSGVARVNYSMRDDRLVEGLAGLEYDGGCWALRLVAYSIAVGTANASRSFFVQLELNGVSRVGSNPLDVLKQNIAGYNQPHLAGDNSLPPLR
ncbi:MAG: LPS-assembly protein LptD [Vicinamibacterales bacterium]